MSTSAGVMASNLFQAVPLSTSRRGRGGGRAADRTIAEVAAANDGRYTIDAHLRHDANASEAFAQAHIRRLEAMRRLMRKIEREADGSWRIAADHLDTAAAFEARQLRDRPVSVEILSKLPLAYLPQREAATWLDRDLTAGTPLPVRDAGFGREVLAAREQRRQWLLSEQLATEQEGQTIYRPGMIATLQRRELLRVAGQLSDELGLAFTEARAGERIEGRLARTVELVSGKQALIERSRDFTLVPWRPVLEPHFGQSVAGLMREEGISWTFGRQRGGPGIS